MSRRQAYVCGIVLSAHPTSEGILRDQMLLCSNNIFANYSTFSEKKFAFSMVPQQAFFKHDECHFDAFLYSFLGTVSAIKDPSSVCFVLVERTQSWIVSNLKDFKTLFSVSLRILHNGRKVEVRAAATSHMFEQITYPAAQSCKVPTYGFFALFLCKWCCIHFLWIQ